MRIVVKAEECSGCRICELICSMEKYRLSNPRVSRIRVVSSLYEGLDQPVLCRHCKRPPCRDACPTNALELRDGLLTLIPALCIGCADCVVACPFGAICMGEDPGVPLICDQCGGRPQCVEYCPTEALRIGQWDVPVGQPRKT